MNIFWNIPLSSRCWIGHSLVCYWDKGQHLTTPLVLYHKAGVSDSIQHQGLC